MKPTDEMVEAGATALQDADEYHQRVQAEHIARLVLTAALASQPEAGAVTYCTPAGPFYCQDRVSIARCHDCPASAAPAPSGKPEAGGTVETSLIDLLDEAITTNDDNFRKWLIARGYAPAPSGMGAVEAKLELIAAMKGQTLISVEHGQPYSIGANAAFEQCAELAREALSALKAEEAGS